MQIVCSRIVDALLECFQRIRTRLWAMGMCKRSVFTIASTALYCILNSSRASVEGTLLTASVEGRVPNCTGQALSAGLPRVVAHWVAGGRCGGHRRVRVVEERRQPAAAAGHRAHLVRREADAGCGRVRQRGHLVLVLVCLTERASTV